MAGQTYYWQTFASDGVYETAGPVWSFTTSANHPPNFPSAPQPANGATNQPVAPSLRWAGGDPDENDAVTYRVYVDRVNPPGIVACSGVSTEVCAASGLSYNTLYYWRVEATDSNGAMTPGPVWTLKTLTSLSNHAPLVPSSPSPINGKLGMRSGFVASWTGGDQDGDAVRYDVYLQPVVAGNLGTLYRVCSQSTTSSCVLGGLLPSTEYRWWVRASDGQLSTDGPTWWFKTGSNNFAPTTPSAPFPAHETIQQPVKPVLRWQSNDPDGDMPRFDVYYASTGGTKQACSTYAYECPLPLLQPNGLYEWWIVAFDGLHVASSPIWSFWTRSNSLPQVSAPTPADGATGLPTNPTLRWTGTDPDGTNPSFLVYVDDSPNTSGSPTCSPGSAAQCALSGLEAGKTYYWKVRASDEFGTTQSPVWSFTTALPSTNLPPEVPAWPSPSDGSQGQPLTAWLTWYGDDPNQDELEYTVYIDPGEGLPISIACSRIKEANCLIENLVPDQLYSWIVKVTDGAQNQTSPIWEFVTSRQNELGEFVQPECSATMDLQGGDPFNADPLYGPGPYNAYACSWSQSGMGWDPYFPSRPVPFDGQTNVNPFDLTLRWMGQNPTGRTYTVYVDVANPPMVPMCETVTNASCGVDQLVPGLTYFWRVATGNGPKMILSPVWQFHVQNCLGAWCPGPTEKAYLGYPKGPQSTETPPEEIDGDSGLSSQFNELADASLFLSGNAPGELACGRSPTNKACTVLVLHGFAGVGGGSPERDIHVDTEFALLREAYEVSGGYDVRLIGYYGGECGMTADSDVTNFGPPGKDSHSEWAAGRGHQSAATTCDGTSRHSRDADIGHLAFHFAWYVYRTFSDQDNDATTPGTTVDIVAHSMGGLLVRYALHQVQKKDPAWPPFLLVETVVDYATPHDGANWACAASPWWSPWQVRQMCSRSGLLRYLREHAQGPKAEGGTKWALIGAQWDEVVSSPSAVDMDGARYYVYRSSKSDPCGNYDHNSYFEEKGDGVELDGCYLYDYSEKRNMMNDHKGSMHKNGFRAIRLGLFEAIT